MTNTDINDLFDNDKWFEWSAKELRKLLRKGVFDAIFFLRLQILMHCYEMTGDRVLYSSDERCVFAGELIEKHFRDTHKRPDPVLLERLATWILVVDKERRRGVLSDRQLRTRNREKEVSFHSPERCKYSLELDGNRYVKPRPGMDSDESHKQWVTLPSDNEDLRIYNQPLKKYSLKT